MGTFYATWIVILASIVTSTVSISLLNESFNKGDFHKIAIYALTFVKYSSLVVQALYTAGTIPYVILLPLNLLLSDTPLYNADALDLAAQVVGVLILSGFLHEMSTLLLEIITTSANS